MGKHLVQLECNGAPLQPYLLQIQAMIRSLDLEASTKTIKAGQSVEYSITLEPTTDLTILFNCGLTDAPLQILHVADARNLSRIPIGNCTYPLAGQYSPILSATNRVNYFNQSLRIEVEPPLSAFKVEIESRPDTSQLTSVIIRTLEPVPFEGNFNLTIVERVNEKNHSRTEHIRLSASSNFTEQFYLNISTYGKQTLHVRGGEYPTIREAEVSFVIGTEITTDPHVYIVNQTAVVNKDLIWLDLQWINGIGFDIEIDFGQEKTVLVRYGQLISSPINRLIKKSDGTHHFEWKRIGKQRLQVGYR